MFELILGIVWMAITGIPTIIMIPAILFSGESFSVIIVIILFCSIFWIIGIFFICKWYCST